MYLFTSFVFLDRLTFRNTLVGVLVFRLTTTGRGFVMRGLSVDGKMKIKNKSKVTSEDLLFHIP